MIPQNIYLIPLHNTEAPFPSRLHKTLYFHPALEHHLSSIVTPNTKSQHADPFCLSVFSVELALYAKPFQGLFDKR
jgi:hypothetical protein